MRIPDTRLEELERLFSQALELEPGERRAFLEQACPDAELRRELEGLLRADAQAGGFLEGPAHARHESLGLVGPYRLVRRLGEGGTGTVYLAVRSDEHYRHRVAIKLIRPGMDSPQMVQRFQQERQILASLNHPNIARLLDGGTTAGGRPYVVMEYIEGEPIDVYCRSRTLGLEQTLTLFRTVCSAVHYAHQNLVVHRDIKPSNILVTAQQVPKLVDFGIAKVLNPELAAANLEPTGTLWRLMTPNYASPEQVQGRPVSTASDVYSLGVLLYKLLTGARPYELERDSPLHIERAICEATPVPPSEVVRCRSQGKEHLPRDLDNIVLMAMRKEPERRYASAQELADDLRRFLEQRPVIARRDTLGYRTGMFVRRHSAAVLASCVVLLSLLAGGVATFWQWQHALEEHAVAEAERERAEQVSAFLVELLKLPDPYAGPEALTAREILERGAARVRRELQSRPDTQATLIHTAGVVHRNLGLYKESAALLEEAVAARTAGSEGSLELAESLYELARTYTETAQHAAAERSFRQALAIRRRLLGEEHLLVAEVLDGLANMLLMLDRPEAEELFLGALAIRRAHLGESDPGVAASLAGLALLKYAQGRYDEADQFSRQALNIRRATRGPQHPDVASSLNLQGLLRLQQGKLDEAERNFKEAIEAFQSVLGNQHPVLADLRCSLAVVWREQGRYDEAERLLRDTLEQRKLLRGEHHSAMDNGLNHLAQLLQLRGRAAEAEGLARRALALREGAYGRQHRSVAQSLALLGAIHVMTDRPAEAEALFSEAFEIWRRTSGEEHPVNAVAMDGLARSLAALGRQAEARQWASRSLALRRNRLQPEHPAIADSLVTLGELLLDTPEEAEPLLREALAIRSAAFRNGDWRIAQVESVLGASLVRHRPGDEAVRRLNSGAEALQRVLGEQHPEARRARERLRLLPVAAPSGAPATHRSG